jgi:hypothetical protein
MKSVFHIRIDSPSYSSLPIQKAFVDNGFAYNGIDWQAHRFNYSIEHLRETLIKRVKELKPTVVFAHIQNPEALDIATWQALADMSFVINYTFDVRSHEQSKWMYDVAKIIGYSYYACLEDVYAAGLERSNILMSSCDMGLFMPRPTLRQAFDVTFVGNKYVGTNLDFPEAEHRQQMISVLQDKYKYRFGCFGLGQKSGMIKMDVEANVYTQSKIAISQNNFQRHLYTSDRIWRIMASGTFCLTRYFPGIESIFEKGKHLDWFTNFEEMTSLIDYYLSDDSKRKKIASVGCRFVRTEHSWTKRIEQLKTQTEPLYVLR